MYQGMYKNRVKNDRIFFVIFALLFCERVNPERENSIYIYIYIFNFPAVFFWSQDKREGISKKNSFDNF